MAAAWFIPKKYGVPVPDAVATATVARLLGLATAAGAFVILCFVRPLSIEEGLEETLFSATLGVGGGIVPDCPIDEYAQKRDKLWLQGHANKKVGRDAVILLLMP